MSDRAIHDHDFERVTNRARACDATHYGVPPDRVTFYLSCKTVAVNAQLSARLDWSCERLAVYVDRQYERIAVKPADETDNDFTIRRVPMPGTRQSWRCAVGSALAELGIDATGHGSCYLPASIDGELLIIDCSPLMEDGQ